MAMQDTDGMISIGGRSWRFSGAQIDGDSWEGEWCGDGKVYLHDGIKNVVEGLEVDNPEVLSVDPLPSRNSIMLPGDDRRLNRMNRVIQIAVFQDARVSFIEMLGPCSRMELRNWSYVDFTMTAHSTRAAHKIKPQNANRQKRGRRLRGNRD